MDPRLPAPVLVLAPHLTYPVRNGADISLDRISAALSQFVPYVDLVAADQVLRYQQGQPVQQVAFANRPRSRAAAVVRTVIRQSHFLLEKFITRAYTAQALEYLDNKAYGYVLNSYLVTTVLQPGTTPSDRFQMIWTHNDEFRWFEDFGSSSNPGIRWVARISLRWLHRFFAANRKAFLCLHVTEQDRSGYARHYPDHQSHIIPIGVELARQPAPPLPPGTAPVSLLFVGALGVRMNLDALVHFSVQYEPALRACFKDGLQVHIAGSNPSPAVEALCRSRRWVLHANVSDEALAELFRRSTFSILPFPYATGAKLKLLHSLAHGVPFLATYALTAQSDLAPPPCLLSDDPRDWVDRLLAVQTRGIDLATRQRLIQVAGQHSWEASARTLFQAMTHTR
jgi:hypothetical protein